ncbi:membrane-bound PQQ-dependent dehydrogenase, glucose/quinate/shikimate family [Sphingomonas sp. AP4-R1]|uniref:membrane-bound PQQ-dependent dehydrogenase, glucose/quinate/shikimate family n=1 Tax=Sphingomonas sp. AP4-R1 TaxID=2735134 RepID=UPI001493CCE2|nr:membrane-bound PQQ-dependent dehydrogenase, glucose/quinate/shikimate family [Sphingomonas sp. AP4-R1]QJU60116.1 membrane-bound PQQ-dependent dehydrogenase, glucose/quinate/shikimate family [Sphingomonas sp. AP4-R1]
MIFAVSGAGLALPGAWLIALGGSAYYLPAGIALLAIAWLAWRRNPAALWLMAALLAVTIIWSLAEGGFDFWALMPRLFFPVALAIGLLLAFRRVPMASKGARPALGVLAAVALVVLLSPLLRGAGIEGEGVAPTSLVSAAPVDWPSYGNRSANRYSPLADITPANVGRLQQAWIYHSGLRSPDGKRRGGLQFNPTMADGLVYGCTAFSTVFALDPTTGRQVWRTDTLVRDSSGGHPACRGVTFFHAPAGTADCPTRIIAGTIDNHLIALDARTGAFCQGFGTGGRADLLDGLGQIPQGWTHPTSPPTIVNGTAVIGAYVVDNQSTEVPPGVIRGYDAVTGTLKWAFDPAKPEARQPPPPGTIYTPSTPNAWTVFSGDDRLNLVFVPMGNGSPDFFGAQRTASTDRLATSLVALDATTGAIRWQFQAVHHDLWDYDLAAQPALVDFPVGNATVPAILLATKTEQLFVLDRRTGRPLTRIEERKAPAASATGERPAPTQPFSVGMPSPFKGDLTERDMWGLTPFDQLSCRIAFRRSVYHGMYTPMGRTPTIRYPGELGGIDWGSVSIDAGRGLLIVNSNHMADRDQLISRAQADREGLIPRVDPRGHSAPGGAMAGTPYAAHWGPFLSALGVPCQKPPYGEITAIDLKTRKAVWTRPLGDARASGPFGLRLGLPIVLGAPNIGGTLATGGGLVFVAATQDEMFRAFDVHSGKLVWQTKLPAGGHATPMSYRGADGHQYVVIPAGGGSLKDPQGDAIVAFRLDAKK